MYQLIIFSTLVWLCVGQDYSSTVSRSSREEISLHESSFQGVTYGRGPSYGPHVPSYLPYGSAYDSYRHSYENNRGQSVLERLDVLKSSIEIRENIQDAQFERVAGIRDEANENVDFANNFNGYVYAEINNEQYQQNSRLDCLEKRIAELQDIRKSVEGLTENADSINEQVVKERDYNKVFHCEINEIQTAETDRANRIEITQQREDFVTARIDFMEDRITENARSMDIEETIVRRNVNSCNGMRGNGEDVVIEPGLSKNPTVINFEPPFLGEPSCNAAFITGVQISNPSSYVQHGIPTIYGGIHQELWDIRSEITASDMSSGNFVLNKFIIGTDNVYFDSTVYSMDSFDGIVTDNF